MEGQLYNVTLHTSFGENYLGDMSEMHLYGYVRTRTGSAAVAERVIEELDEKGVASVVFEQALGEAVRAEIRLPAASANSTIP
jgi:hypothetical protein